MAVGFSKTNKPLNPRGNDQSPKGYNRAALYSGKALDFDGVNDYLTFDGFAGTLSNNDAWTVCGYFKTSNVNRGTWFSAHNSSGGNIFRIGTESSNALGLFYADNYQFDTQIGDFDFRDDKMHFVVLSRAQGANGSLATLYVDGIESATQTTGPNWDSATQFSLGQEYDGGSTSDFWDGLLANFKIFNTALTAAQVSDLYNNPEKIVPTGVEDTALKLWLPMMEGAGTTAYDGSGNGNHGTISGATWTHGVGSPVAQTAVIDWNKGTNSILNTEDFTAGSYTTTQYTRTEADATAPNGLSNAARYKETAANSVRYIMLTGYTFQTSEKQVIGVFAKYDGAQYIQFAGLGLQAANEAPVFDIQNGVVHTASTTNTCLSAFIEDAGNGWYKCSAVCNPSGGALFQLYGTSQVTHNSDVFQGDTNDGFYLWGPFQIENEDTKRIYIPNPTGSEISSDVLLPQGLTTGRDITGVNLFENVRKQGALNLDGNSWAEVHDNASLDVSEISVECWIYWQNGSDDGIIAKWSGTTKRSYMLYKLNSTTARFYLSTNGSNQTNVSVYTSFSEGNWYHIVGTYDGANMKTYTNGVLFNSTALTGNIFGNDKPLEIGRFDENDTLIMPDGIAQPRIYDRALTAAEVLQNYNSGKSIYTNS